MDSKNIKWFECVLADLYLTVLYFQSRFDHEISKKDVKKVKGILNRLAKTHANRCPVKVIIRPGIPSKKNFCYPRALKSYSSILSSIGAIWHDFCVGVAPGHDQKLVEQLRETFEKIISDIDPAFLSERERRTPIC